MRNLYILFILSITNILCIGQDNLVKNTCDFINEFETPDNIICGKIEVPENHDRPNGRVIEIAYVLIKAKNQLNKSPMIYFNGGPGGSGISSFSISNWMKSAINEKRDIILFDQRGIGHSSPLPNMYPRSFEIMSKNVDTDGEQRMMEELIEEYKIKCKAQNIDVRNYNSFQNASDVGILMQHLGYEKYNLYGVSYGTRLARIVQDMFPEFVSSVIHNSPSPFTGDFLISRLDSYTLALQRVFNYCKNNESCNSKYPELQLNYQEAINSLKEYPIEVKMDSGIYYVNPQDGIYLIRRYLYSDDARQKIPDLINALHLGGGETINDIVNFEFRFSNAINLSMLLSVERSEMFDLSYSDNDINEYYKNTTLLPAAMGFFNSFYKAGKKWHNVTIPKQKRTFVQSKIPTLVTVNHYDPVTPPSYGHIFKETLVNGTLLILDEGGHGGGNRECATEVMISFMDNPYEELDISCLNLFTE